MNGSPYIVAACVVVLAAGLGCGSPSSARERDEAAAARQRDNQSAAAAPPEASPPAASTAIQETTFDDIKFPMAKTEVFAESMLTDRVRGMFGQRIRIRGYIYPTPRRTGLKQFVLVRDNLECCFGPGAALFDCVLVTMKDGATADYTIRPVAVEGEFRFEPLIGPDQRPMAIYQMAGEAVK